jgi:hypothetical protein
MSKLSVKAHNEVPPPRAPKAHKTKSGERVVVPRPNRLRHKKQVTLRIDELLLDATLQQAELEGLRLTDIVEDSLWRRLRPEKQAELPVRGRFLWSVLSHDLQEHTMDFWAFCAKPWAEDWQEIARKTILQILSRYRESPRWDRQARLRDLAPEGGEADA